MNIQVELNIIADNDLKNQWGDLLNKIDCNIQRSQHIYSVCEFIFTYSDLSSPVELEDIMEKSYLFIKEKYKDKANSFHYFKVMKLDENILYCYIIAENYRQLEKAIKKTWKTILNYQAYFKHHYLIYMASPEISFNTIRFIEKQKIKLITDGVLRGLFEGVCIFILLSIYQASHNLVLVFVMWLISSGIIWYLDRPGGIRISGKF